MKKIHNVEYITLLTIYADDDYKDKHHKKERVKLKIKHVVNGTTVVATCDFLP